MGKSLVIPNVLCYDNCEKTQKKKGDKLKFLKSEF